MGLLDRWLKTDRAAAPRTPVEAECSLADLPALSERTPIADCVCRSAVRVAGVVRSVRSSTDPTKVEFEAQIDDGTGTLSLVWRGRHTIPGIQVGRLLIAKGTVGKGPGDELRILDPQYSIQVVEG